MTSVERRFGKSTLPNEALKAVISQGLGATWSWVEDPGPVDGKLTIFWRGGERTFPVVLKLALSAGAVELLPPVPGGVVLANEIKPAVRKALEAAGWGYLDSTGAASFAAPGLLVRLDGWRRPAGPPSIERPFSRTGLPVTFVLLVRGSLEEVGTQRDLAALAGASLGTTNRVLKGLRELGYLSKDGVLLKQAAMADRWTESYLALSGLGGFDAPRYSSGVWSSPTEVLTGIPSGVYAGSELAARGIGMSIRPKTALLYCSAEKRKDVIVAGRLRHDPDGWIQLRDIFWGKKLLEDKKPVAPEILIRADLLAETDPRLTDLAKQL
jgi:hypothetical protein